MKTIHYEQIIYASSQKSIINGQPGFGVRTKSPGVSDVDAETISTAARVNYLTDEVAKNETIVANPDMESIYPSLYTYRSVRLNNGETRYIIAKTFYVAIDYGFFANIAGANRVGSNYIAHVMVFEDDPTVAALSEAVRSSLFVPHNTLCTPDNEEIRSLLVGDPTPLTDGYITFDDSQTVPQIEEELGWLTIALLQTKKNEYAKPHAPQGKGLRMMGVPKNILFKVNHEKVNDLLCAMGSLPNDLTEGVFFQANAMLQKNLPDGLRMLIINEKNPIPTDDNYNITVDMLGETPKTYNIDENYLYTQIIKSSRLGSIEKLNETVELFGKLQSDLTLDDWIGLVNNDAELCQHYLDTIYGLFAKEIASNPVAAVERLLSVSKESRDLLNVDSVVLGYVNMVEKNPYALDREKLAEILRNLKLQPSTIERVRIILDILDKQDISPVDSRILTLAIKLGDDWQYSQKLFFLWLNSHPKVEEIATVIEKYVLTIKSPPILWSYTGKSSQKEARL